MGEFDKDSDCIAYALDMWANHIETGDVNLCHNDVVQRLQHLGTRGKAGDLMATWDRNEHRETMAKLRFLDEHQKAFVARLRELARRASVP